MWFFDKGAIGNSSLRAKKHSDIMLYSAMGPGYISSALLFEEKQKWYFGLETLAITDISNLLIKHTFKRKRPFTRGDVTPKVPEVPACHKYDRGHLDSKLSFYSGHAAHVSAFTFFTPDNVVVSVSGISRRQ